MKNVILIKHPSNWGLDGEVVLRAAERALKKRKQNGVELSVIFVGRKRAKELNIKYRKKRYVPQVLGFPMSREKDVDGMVRLGDVVICTQKIKYETVFQNKTIDDILGEWLLHGVDNLLK